MSKTNHEQDRGAASVLAAFLIAALAAITVGGVHIGAAVLARHRAQAAADLAVVAAAMWLPVGPAMACDGAGQVSDAMGAVLRECDIHELDVVVTVTVAAGGRIGSEARATARAGPLDRAR